MQSLEKSSSSIDGDPKFILRESSTPFSLFNIYLPFEMEMKIFSYLDAKDLCVTSKVNQAWNTMSQENLLWKELCREEIEKEKCPRCYRERNEGIDDDIRGKSICDISFSVFIDRSFHRTLFAQICALLNLAATYVSKIMSLGTDGSNYLNTTKERFTYS